MTNANFQRSLFACLAGVVVFSEVDAWEPRPGWRDSYAVDGICYCDSSNFDHGIGKVELTASDGYARTVKQICTDIETQFGVGALEGRIPYNTIACGNAPANDAPDEDLITGCPGRVDLGASGCFELGPQWPLAEIYGAPISARDRSGWTISASDNPKNTAAMADSNLASRWSTNRLQRPGQWIQIDLGGLHTVDVIDLVSTGSVQDYPVNWTLELSPNSVDWIEARRKQSGAAQVLEQGEVTRLTFESAEAQYLRVTQTGSSPKYYWSIHEIYIGLLAGE